MKLSIIVPVFNEEPYLRRCLDSIKRSCSSEVEAIIVDDCSTDGSGAICDEYDFKVIHSDENHGVSVSRNIGMKEAQGEFITFLDSDDYIAAGGLETILRAMRIFGDEFDLIQFNHFRSRNGEITPRTTNPNGRFTAAHPPKLFCYVWNKVYRREFIEQNDIRFIPDMSYGEDEIFNLECLYHAGHLMSYAERAVVHCYENDGSLSRTVKPDGLIRMSEEIHQIIKLKDKPFGMESYLRQLISDIWNSGTYKRILNG